MARTHYETIEPVAESFGDLDPEIDARVNDVAAGARWTGFHRIEKALWQDGTTDGHDPVADKLVTDVKRLHALVRTVDLQAAQIANGAVELLDEVANSKITGEEDRYSHTDLADFEANVAGVEAAVTALTPAMHQGRPRAAGPGHDPARRGGERAGPVPHQGRVRRLHRGQRPAGQAAELTSQVNALAETLSKVAPAVA